MINAKEELLRKLFEIERDLRDSFYPEFAGNFVGNLPIKISNKFKIKCAEIETYHLKIGYSKEDYENFLTLLDYEYDNGFGSQRLYGTVWFEGGTWLSRGEYDGSEWWNYNEVPIIPDYLIYDWVLKKL